MKIQACRKSLLSLRPPAFVAALCLTIVMGSSQFVVAQSLGYERDRGVEILNVIKTDIKKNYYDPTFRGIDLEARFKVAMEKVKTAESNGQINAIIAQLLTEFNDSHLYFNPPGIATDVEYGWLMQMIGDKCFVTAVQPKSDAEAKGLRPGDEIYSIDGYQPTRDNLWKILYTYNRLKPKSAVRFVIQKPNGQQELEVKSKVTEERVVRGHVLDDYAKENREIEKILRKQRQRFYEKIDDLFVWKMPNFATSGAKVDNIMDRVRKRKALILDLRGNGGGAVETLERLVGNFFDRDLQIFERKGRKEKKPAIAKTRGKDIFTGKLVVLLDGQSGSAAELFARLVQLEKRGIVIGDRSSGSVMEALQFSHTSGAHQVNFYSVSVTVSDPIMSDGKTLEHVGVIPDEILLPSAADMAEARDPVLTRAASLLGFKLEPELAGSLFPIEWD